jgi:putative IMPACT (imprinted ancient) family translation regulator
MLTVLLHSGIGDVAAVVTRYYGGIKLGTGGLVKAYSGAVQQALDAVPRVERVDYVEIDVVLPYGSIATARRLLPAYEAELVGEAYGEDVQFTVRLPETHVAALRAALLDATAGQAR